MSGTGFFLSLWLSSTVFTAPNTIEWNDELCRYRGTFDSSKIPPEVLQNTVKLVVQGPALFQDEGLEKTLEVHPDFAQIKEKYANYARYTEALAAQKSAYARSDDPLELKKSVLGRPMRPLCDRFVELLAEKDLKKKMSSFLRVAPAVCREQGGSRKDCEHIARVHVQAWTSLRKANQSLVGTDWNNCMIYYDEVHQLPRPELASLFQTIEPSECIE